MIKDWRCYCDNITMIFVAYKTTDSQHLHRLRRSILQTELATESNLLTEKEVYRKYLDQGIDWEDYVPLNAKSKSMYVSYLEEKMYHLVQFKKQLHTP